MKKKVIEKIKSLCTGEIKFICSEQNLVTVLLPYSTAEIGIEIDGDTDDEQIESFISGINQVLDDMIDHLGDCKL